MTPGARPARPVLDVAACLLDRAATAACDACARACPTGALRAESGGLDLVADLCTGCGGCGAACPAGALAVDGTVPLPLPEADAAGRSLLVCPVRSPQDPQAICAQALGLEALATLWLRGGRRIWLDTGACTDCPSGQGLGLSAHMETLNRLLADRGLPGLVAEPAPDRAAERVPRLGQSPDRRRRGLLGLAALRRDPAGDRAPVRALARLQKLGPGRSPRRFAHVPVIDPLRCSACHACVRLCHESALTLIKAATGDAAYRVDAARCTGCGLCAGCCEERAVRIEGLADEPDEVSLVTRRCRGCGAPYQRPAARAECGGTGADGLCPICTRAPHFRKLHQILP